MVCHFYGPYQIEKRIGAIAYRLKLPKGSRIHLVFHVSLLKKQLRDAVTASENLPATNHEGLILLILEAIQDTRWVKKGSKFIEECLVK